MAVPEYLYWVLQRDKNRMKILQNSSGSTAFGTISSGLIGSLSVTMLPIQQQKTIGDLLLLSEREQELLRRLAEEKKKYSTYRLNDIYTKMKRGF